VSPEKLCYDCSALKNYTTVQFSGDELAYLRSSLKEYAGQVLWDYEDDVTDSLSRLTKTLKERFVGKAQADKHQIEEIRNRRGKSGETLQTFHSDIRKLAALVFPMLDHQARETISCDYFLDAVADPDFAFKVRERMPVDLGSTLRIALQLEVWMKDVDRLRNEKRSDERKTPEFTKSELRSDQVMKKNEALRKEAAE